MSTPKKTVIGYVVVHKESNVQYAVSVPNFNQKIHDKVRDLKRGETVRGYAPRLKNKGSASSETPDVALFDVTPEVTPEITK